MIDLLMPFQAFLKLEHVRTDNNVFRMHYKLTVAMLLVATLLVTSKQLFGEPIYCYRAQLVYKEATNSYCWIYGTYIVRNQLNGTEGKHNAYPGVGPYSGERYEEVYQNYYQWVCFVLLIQAALFYFPRYLWKVWEAGRLKILAADLASPMIPKEWSQFRKNELVTYLAHTNIYTHNLYAVRFAVCEILNLCNVVAQIFFLDLFLGGSFLTYGSAVASFNHRPNGERDFNAVDPTARYFPKLTKCLFRYYGPSGGIQTLDLVCVLPINIINEKIFIVLWFWLVFLAFVSLCAVVYRIFVFSVPAFRTLLIMGQVRYVKRYHVTKIVKMFNFGDWFVLYQLGKNLNPLVYKELILEISTELDHKTVMI